MKHVKPNMTTEKTALIEIAGPVIELLQAPSELPKFLTVVGNLQTILELAVDVDQETALLKKMQRAYGSITKILDHADEFEHHFPVRKDVIDPLNGSKSDNPLYCAIGYKPEPYYISKQWFAMTASLLPIADRLVNGVNKNYPKDWAFTIGFLRSVRYLAQEQSDVSRSILLELNNEAQTTAQFQEQLQRVEESFSFTINHDRDTKDFWYIKRALDWYTSGTKRVIEHREFSNQRRSSRTIGRLQGRKDSESPLNRKLESKAVRCPDANETPHTVVRFFEHPDRLNGSKTSIDADLARDRPERGATLKLELLPSQDPNRLLSFYLQNRAKQASHRATYAARSIEMSNQHLPIQNSTLTAIERETFLSIMLNANHPIWSQIQADQPQMAAWGLSRFLLSQESDKLKKLTWYQAGDSEMPPLSFCSQSNRLCMPSVGPNHKAPPSNAVTIAVQTKFELQVPNWFGDILRSAKLRKSKTIFSDTHEQAFIDLLNCINREFGTELSSSRIVRAVQDKMSQLAPADRVFSTYFLGQLPNQHNPSVYSAIPVQRIQMLFNQAWTSLCRASALVSALSENRDDRQAQQGTLHSLIHEDEPHIGSMFVPKATALAEEIQILTNRLKEHSESKQVKCIEQHNDYTSYTVLFLLAITGIRLTNGLLPVWFDMDPKTGSTFVSDKDGDEYGHARVIWMPPSLVQHMQLYQQHIPRLRQILALCGPGNLGWLDGQQAIAPLSSQHKPERHKDLGLLDELSAPCLLALSEHYQLKPITNHWLCKQVSPEWEIRLGSLRHFVRTSLLQAGVSGEVIDALMGHSERGQQPWGPYSSLPPCIWREQLSQALEPILKSLRLQPLQSPFLP